MSNLIEFRESFLKGEFERKFKKDLHAYSLERYIKLIDLYKSLFPASCDNVVFVSAPGRTEIGGNHTDHQHGCVLTASVNLDVIAIAASNNENIIRVQSEGYPLDEVDLSDLKPDEDEYNQAKALIKGVAARMLELGYEVRGFNAYTASNVLKGSGLSSSAAFEVLIANIIKSLFGNSSLNSTEIAKIAQYSENVYFGKPCGLMDQMASSTGGIVFIDFKNPEDPLVEEIDFDFEKFGYALCIIDSGADHAGLTDEYAAIPEEMKKVAGYFNKDILREVKKEEFITAIPKLRDYAGDRAVIRALHFFNENERVLKEVEALKNRDIKGFLNLVKESGRSSYMYLQNVNVAGSVKEQALGVILALCEEFLKDEGAYRVHGGGFAGTVQAFVPLDKLEEFRQNIEKASGLRSCHVLSIRPCGGVVYNVR